MRLWNPVRIIFCSSVPFEMVKQQLQAGLHKSSLDAVRSIYRRFGLVGFTYGYIANVCREVPFDAIQFTLWEHLKPYFASSERENTRFAWSSVMSGAIAGGVAAAATTPLDVAKTRLMTNKTGQVRFLPVGLLSATVDLRTLEHMQP